MPAAFLGLTIHESFASLFTYFVHVHVIPGEKREKEGRKENIFSLKGGKERGKEVTVRIEKGNLSPLHEV